MGEVVYLEKYRLARAMLRARAIAHKWRRLRFTDLDCFDWSSIPPIHGGDDVIVYMKSEHDAGCFWGNSLEHGPRVSFSGHSSFRLAPDMPVIHYTDT